MVSLLDAGASLSGMFIVIFSVLGGVISQGKNRGFGVGFLWGFLLGPIGLIIVACMRQGVDPGLYLTATRRHVQGPNHNQNLNCGSCGGSVTRQMNLCPMCGVAIAWPQEVAQQVARPAPRRRRMR